AKGEGRLQIVTAELQKTHSSRSLSREARDRDVNGIELQTLPYILSPQNAEAIL
ncbi:unnamed protein product, partial [Arabidopsis halleri]